MPDKPSAFLGKTHATILFCDIREFTSLFDRKDPAEALEFANTVLANLAEQVERNKGVIDKFTGDGFLAHFGAFNQLINHADAACQCALDLQRALSDLNSNRYLQDQPVVSIGVGIHSGEVAVGFIRTKAKVELTALGSAVNIASRVESLTKMFSVTCLITQDCKDALELKNDIKLLAMPVHPIKGIAESVKTYWILPTNI